MSCTNGFLTPPGDVIWEPGSSSNNFFKFSPLDDVVMGGASKSFIDNETGIWRGTVTTANNGGFVGIRSTPFDHQPTSLDMTRCTGLTIKVKNGKTAKMDRFKAVVRDSTALNGVSWTTSFDTSSTTPCTVKIPFGKQRPSIFARTVPNVVFKKGNVVGFQFTYSKVRADNEQHLNGTFVCCDVWSFMF